MIVHYKKNSLFIWRYARWRYTHPHMQDYYGAKDPSHFLTTSRSQKTFSKWRTNPLSWNKDVIKKIVRGRYMPGQVRRDAISYNIPRKSIHLCAKIVMARDKACRRSFLFHSEFAFIFMMGKKEFISWHAKCICKIHVYDIKALVRSPP